jgi:hypothetical protein
MKNVPVKFETAVYGDCKYYVKPVGPALEKRPVALGKGS